MGRIIWIILDSVGIGQAEDACKFGDEGSDTLGHIYEKYLNVNGIQLKNLQRLGLGNIDDVNKNIKASENPVGIYCKAGEVSKGKDTTTGHWEMCGIITDMPFVTFYDGFPDDIINKFVNKLNLPGVLGNKVASGTEIIKELGEEHIKSKKPIVYTSADSVFQIACHEEVYSKEELYNMCQVARNILVGKDAVARVIARPFKGQPGAFVRTPDRRDFSLKPDVHNTLVELVNNGIDVYAVGKIEDIFAGVGISQAVHTVSNMDGVDKTIAYMDSVDRGLIFTNLVEFDSTFGHRRDLEGYSKGLIDFDKRLEEIIEKMRDDDLLIMNADHGCDPTFKGTDHTREYIPVLMFSKSIEGFNAGVRDSFCDVGATVSKYFGLKPIRGKSII